MSALLILLLVLAVIVVAALTGLLRVTRPEEARPPAPAPLPPEGSGVERLVLRLPEPARTRAWTLLCTLADAAQANVEADARTRFLLTQTRERYLPDTVEAYLGLSSGARRALLAQGQPAEQLLEEQLDLMTDGVREALRHEHAAADRLLTQGRFLRERFGPGEALLPVGDPFRD